MGPLGRVVGVVVGGRCGVGVGRRFPATVAGGSPVDRAVAGAAPPDADPVLRVVPPVPDVTLGGTLADADPARYDFVSVVHAVTLEARRAAHLYCCLFFCISSEKFHYFFFLSPPSHSRLAHQPSPPLLIWPGNEKQQEAS